MGRRWQLSVGSRVCSGHRKQSQRLTALKVGQGPNRTQSPDAMASLLRVFFASTVTRGQRLF